MSVRTHLLCAWSSPASTVLWLVGFFLLAGFVPPLSPAASAQEIAAIYRRDHTMILLGLCVTMMGAALIGPFVAGISQQMKRIEGGRSTPLADIQLGLGMLMIVMFIIPCFLMGTAAFRPERDPELILALNDAGWLPFVGAFQCTFFQLLAIAAAVFQDREQRVFPRWLAFFNLWVAFLLLPAGLVLFFKRGPFAWNGLLAFWFVVVVFVAWFLVMFVELRKAVLREAAEAQVRSPTAEVSPAGRLSEVRR